MELMRSRGQRPLIVFRKDQRPMIDLKSALPMLEVALITIVCFSFFVLIYSQKLPLLLSCSKRNGMNA